MITILIAENKEKVNEIVGNMLRKVGNANIGIIKQENTIKIIERNDLKEMVSLKDKIIELEESLYFPKKGSLYKSILEAVEKPVIEYVLERVEGNQLKAARILGMNRNTIRVKIKKLGINCATYKL